MHVLYMFKTFKNIRINIKLSKNNNPLACSFAINEGIYNKEN